MRTRINWTISLLMTIGMFFISSSVHATVTTKADQKSNREIQKENKHQGKIHKKIHKIQNRIIKAKMKAGAPVLDDAGFLEGADDRVRWGLVGLAGGLLLVILLARALKWIGWLGVIGGLALLVWYLIEDMI